ncbi:hypothetical protein [Ancylobacter lacus]|uniref:hypothetical protein n=1 Tax=Ancylobacter lacus TaxID=2579970 RepID=UPI001BD070EC|nr:hypothetical protein [Ancylobacter lacus]MBS7539125.1 hypothetical protein [Ancylobacter lacus]
MTGRTKRAVSLRAVLAVAVLAGGLAGAAVAAPVYATKEAFTAAVSGKSLSSTTKKNKPIVVHYLPGGSGDLTIGGDKPQSLTWTFKGDVLCTTVKAWSFTECNKVVLTSPTAADFIDAKSGQLNNTYTIH